SGSTVSPCRFPSATSSAITSAGSISPTSWSWSGPHTSGSSSTAGSITWSAIDPSLVDRFYDPRSVDEPDAVDVDRRPGFEVAAGGVGADRRHAFWRRVEPEPRPLKRAGRRRVDGRPAL